MATEDNSAEIKLKLENIRDALTKSRSRYETDLDTVKQGLHTIYTGSPIVENAIAKINNVISTNNVEDKYDLAFSAVKSGLEE